MIGNLISALTGNASLFTFQVGGGLLDVVRFAGSEGVSSLFEFRVELAGQDIELSALVDQPALLTIGGIEEPRYIHGHICHAEATGQTRNLYTYVVSLVPQLWRLRMRQDSRIFQKKTTPQILEEVLTKAGISKSKLRFDLTSSYEPRDFCVQYPVLPALRSAGGLAADLGSNVAGMAGGLGGEERLNRAYFWLRDRCGEVPEAAMKTVDVYGFSRGAALARTFVNLVNLGLRRSQPQLNVRFVGVFDTVGSFGLAGNEYDPGQSMYVDGTDAQRIVHLTARHEHRHNFPLTIIPGIDEEYPGVHSDVGGSYPPSDEDGRVNHIVYIPLTDMYNASARMEIPMDPLAGEIAGGVDVEALRREAQIYAGPDQQTSTDRAFSEARDRFFHRYVHESTVIRSRWWYAAGPIGEAVVYFNPNKGDSSGARRKFTPRRKRLVALPPGFSWR